jgi:hypothetical protein
MLADLVICYTKPGHNSLEYLGPGIILKRSRNFGANYAKKAIDAMTEI